MHVSPPDKDPLSTFTADDASGLPGPDWLKERRTAAMTRFLAEPLPTDADEIWRYSRINDFDLSAYHWAPEPEGWLAHAELPQPVLAFLAAVGSRAGLAVTVNGHLVHLELGTEAARAGVVMEGVATATADFDDVGAEGVEGEGTARPDAARSGGAATRAPLGQLTDEADPPDAFIGLNDAAMADAIVIRVPAQVEIPEPFVVCHWIDGDGLAVFPRTTIDIGANAGAVAVDALLSADVVAFVDPVVELVVGDGGRLEHLVVQQLGPQVWQTAYHGSVVGKDASLRSFTVALGGDYARVRTDSRLSGSGGTSEILALYFGEGSQMHDFRTLQDHEAPKTTSDLVFKGAVVDEARSAYSGMIRVHKGAAGTKALQTNRNLVLSDTGLATYSVPNLDIQDNEVTCSHASATGPIDLDQRFYLESRGVPTDVAERLIVLGFFDDLLSRLPIPSLRDRLWAAVAEKLNRSSLTTASLLVSMPLNVMREVIRTVDETGGGSDAPATSQPGTVDDPISVDEEVNLEHPTTEVASDATVVDVPVVESPSVDVPVIESRGAEVPVIESPSVEVPAVESPVGEAPVIGSSIVGQPVADSPTVGSMAVESPVAPVLEPQSEVPSVAPPAVEPPTAPVAGVQSGQHPGAEADAPVDDRQTLPHRDVESSVAPVVPDQRRDPAPPARWYPDVDAGDVEVGEAEAGEVEDVDAPDIDSPAVVDEPAINDRTRDGDDG
jgi:Fe-S cluster assembly protein SufD